MYYVHIIHIILGKILCFLNLHYGGYSAAHKHRTVSVGVRLP